VCLTFSTDTQGIDHVENGHLLCGSLRLLPLDRALLSHTLIKRDSKAMEMGPLGSWSRSGSTSPRSSPQSLYGKTNSLTCDKIAGRCREGWSPTNLSETSCPAPGEPHASGEFSFLCENQEGKLFSSGSDISQLCWSQRCGAERRELPARCHAALFPN